MDAPPAAGPQMRLVMDVARSVDGRLEGRVRSTAIAPPAEFSGVLELLKVLEDFVAPLDPQGAHHE